MLLVHDQYSQRLTPVAVGRKRLRCDAGEQRTANDVQHRSDSQKARVSCAFQSIISL
jgi:hypothetical protein